MQNLDKIFQSLDRVSWYPGHMKRAMSLMEQKIGDVQLFLEIRDARVPFSSKNYHFDTLLRTYNKEKIILFNKFDLCDQEITLKIIKKYQAVGINCMAISAQKRVNLSEILTMAQSLKVAQYGTVGIWLMICGMPNVGKSTLINQLRQTVPKLNKRKALAKQTPLPCTTKSVTGIRISDMPLAYLIDSPGVMIPHISDSEQAMKLGVVGCIKDKIVEKERLVDYLIWSFNKSEQSRYFQLYGLKQKPQNGGEYMLHIREKFKQYNYETTLDFILDKFRDGTLGKITLDDPSILD